MRFPVKTGGLITGKLQKPLPFNSSPVSQADDLARFNNEYDIWKSFADVCRVVLQANLSSEKYAYFLEAQVGVDAYKILGALRVKKINNQTLELISSIGPSASRSTGGAPGNANPNVNASSSAL